ncbi:hypothetical protein [Kitasatospora sp. NPDC093679]|uniref:hypothetical protein n=1 Tax=Kitasatospora sp. NPDC093679 TaxID=3154983 RepID=UPI003428622B
MADATGAPTAAAAPPGAPPPASPSVAPQRAARVPGRRAAGVVGFVAGAAVVGLVWGIGSGSPAFAGMFSLSGTVTLPTGLTRASDECTGTGGYAGIAQHTAVAVYDDHGKLLATGTLGPGRSSKVARCDFPVEIADVPKGGAYYQVELDHRVRFNVPRERAEGGPFGVALQ